MDKSLPTFNNSIPRFAHAHELVSQWQPHEPVYCTRPHAVTAAVAWHVANFPGRVMYAVKTNPDADVLRLIHAAGVTRFDVASLAEVELVSWACPGAEMFFMHPIKSPHAIAQAYHVHAVKNFCVDTMQELDKILAICGHDPDVVLFVRMSVSNHHAAYSLSNKFGCDGAAAIALMQAIATAGLAVAVCFHVGSQCMDPQDYVQAMRHACELVQAAQVDIAALDIGGGLPSCYPDMQPPAWSCFMQAIATAIQDLGIDHVPVLCEPGRALVAESGSIIVQVHMRKHDTLYINDGIYGGLSDAGHPRFRFPLRLLRNSTAGLHAFDCYGPTCDSMDYMPGPWMLPADVGCGDWIEVGGLGAYSQVLRTNFNGFASSAVACLADAPIMSMLDTQQRR